VQSSIKEAASLFVQPHFDDVAFSCGGMVALAAERGERPVVLTLFAQGSVPGAPLTDLARELHESWGQGESAIAARQEEDRAACRILGATPCWLSQADAIYRGSRYPRAIDLFAEIHEDDRTVVDDLARELADAWRASKQATIHLPLGVGHHVDHQVAHLLGEHLERSGAAVCYYEDLPYALVHGSVERRLTAIARPLESRDVDVGAQLDRKVSAIRAYASQLANLSAQFGPLEQRIPSYAERLGGGSRRIERVWGRLSGAPP
jgi:LmbE family N-acetylglucosaminyl deacetylase